MDIFFAFDSCSGVVGGVENFIRQTHRHCRLTTFACQPDKPSNCKTVLTATRNLDRNLIGAATDPARANLDRWPDVVNCSFEDDGWVLAGALLDRLERARSFFPFSRTLLITWLTRALRKTGSGSTVRFWAGALRTMNPSLSRRDCGLSCDR